MHVVTVSGRQDAHSPDQDIFYYFISQIKNSPEQFSLPSQSLQLHTYMYNFVNWLFNYPQCSARLVLRALELLLYGCELWLINYFL